MPDLFETSIAGQRQYLIRCEETDERCAARSCPFCCSLNSGTHLRIDQLDRKHKRHHQRRARSKGSGLSQCRHDRLLAQVHADTRGRHDRRSFGIEARRDEPIPPRIACLEVDRNELEVRWNTETKFDESLSLPLLRAGLINLEHPHVRSDLRPEIASHMRVFEIDQPGPQEWKRERLVELGLGIPSYLKLVPVDFEAGDAWWDRLVASGFDSERPAVVASTGVSMYLSKDAIMATLRQVAALAAGSTLVMSFMLPIELVDPEVRPGVERAAEGARASGTPFISFFTSDEILALARDAGFKEVRHISADMLAQLYFADRTDGLRPPRNSEELLVATT